jgi:hypothetical protein
MEAFEKAKLALRQFLLENKEKVRVDLEDMRSKSIGNDIYNYVVNYSNSLSFSDINVVIEPIVDANIDVERRTIETMKKDNKNRNRWMIAIAFDIDRWKRRENRVGVKNLGRLIRKALNNKEDDNN